MQRALVENPAISTLLYRSDAAIYDVRSLFSDEDGHSLIKSGWTGHSRVPSVADRKSVV